MVLLKNPDVFYIQLQHVNIMISESVGVTATRRSAAAGFSTDRTNSDSMRRHNDQNQFTRVKQTSLRLVPRMIQQPQQHQERRRRVL